MYSCMCTRERARPHLLVPGKKSSTHECGSVNVCAVLLHVREREVSVDYTVTSLQIRNLERKPGWTDEGMDSSLLTDREGQRSDSHEAGEGYTLN